VAILEAPAACIDTSTPVAALGQGIRLLNGCITTRIYCRENCPPGRRTKPENRVHFASAAEARDAGYRPCKVCQPDRFSGPWVTSVTARAAAQHSRLRSRPRLTQS